MSDASQLASYARLLRLTPVDGVTLQSAQATDLINSEASTPTIAAKKAKRGVLSFLLLVVLPVAIVAGYFWLFAANRYESEVHFVLRTPGRNLATSAISNLLQSTGVTRANDDAFIVREFLESRDAANWLERHSKLRSALAVPKRDILWKFPSPLLPDNDEGLYRLFKRLTSASYDETTGVGTLKVQAFTPQDANRLAAGLLKSAEDLVNRLNERARKDAVGIAEAELDRVQQRAYAAQASVTAFRERERLVDPSQVTLAVLETIARLSGESATISVQLSQLSKSSPNAPQLAALRGKRAALEEQILKERHKLAGDAQSIAPRIAEYERLMLDREFAARALMAAMTAVEVARIDAARQQVYLEQVTAPSRPDYPAYPWRIVWCFATLVAGYMAWRMWNILARDALSHIEP